MIILRIAIVVYGLLMCSCCYGQVKWSIILEQPGKLKAEIGRFDEFTNYPITIEKTIDGIHVGILIENKAGLILFKADASAESTPSCFISLRANYISGVAFSYNRPETSDLIYRQSPHDPQNYNLNGLIKQAIPMIAVKGKDKFWIAVSDSPGFYNNFTTQTFNSSKNELLLSSGDSGEVGGSNPKTVKIESYYHPLDNGKHHIFQGIIFESHANNLNEMRKDVLSAIAKRWGDKIEDRLGQTAFSSNYMLIRVNETKNSNYWVVPGIEYSNKLYSRDAFWQSMVLPKDIANECYKNEAVAQSSGAERPLLCMIWAYRTKLEGGSPDMEAARKTLVYIENHTKEGWYYSSVDNQRDFQSWCDLAAFEPNDVITYNQGLLAVALMSAEKLGLKPTTSSLSAIRNYQMMFNEKKGYFPFSQQKDLLAVDPLVGDLLAQLYFGKALLSDDSVVRDYEYVRSHAKTPFGFKVTCLQNGEYAPRNIYGSKDHPSTWVDKGSYQWGGSWYLYDMLFLIDCYLHNAPDAMTELKWRCSLDFNIGGTYFEYINTVTGKPGKANQGWDAAVYAIMCHFHMNKQVDPQINN